MVTEIDVAILAGRRGDKGYAEELIRGGAKLNDIAKGAVRGGHHAYVEELLNRGANLNELVNDARFGDHISLDIDTQYRFLSRYSTTNITAWVHALAQPTDVFTPLAISAQTQQRAARISQLMHKHQLDYPEAYLATELAAHHATLFLIALIFLPNIQPITILPTDLWLHMMSFLAPADTSPHQLKQLGFALGRILLATELQYMVDSAQQHAARAATLADAIAQCNDRDELQQVIAAEPSAQHPDRYATLIKRWQNRFSLGVCGEPITTPASGHTDNPSATLQI